MWCWSNWESSPFLLKVCIHLKQLLLSWLLDKEKNLNLSLCLDDYTLGVLNSVHTYSPLNSTVWCQLDCLQLLSRGIQNSFTLVLNSLESFLLIRIGLFSHRMIIQGKFGHFNHFGEKWMLPDIQMFIDKLSLIVVKASLCRLDHLEITVPVG